MEQPLALISGGLGDIGRAIAHELARRGAVIALCDQAATPSGPLPTPSYYSTVDCADPEAVAAWVAAVTTHFGRPADWIIANAGRVTLKSALEVTPTEWQQELAVNLSGSFALAQAAAKALVAAGQPGRIVFVGSWAAHAPHPSLPAYCVTKAGLRMLMRCLALELAPHGILVNEVAPGYVDAGLSGRIFAERPEVKARALSQVPIGQLMAPEDVAAQVGWLCDPANRHQTGSVVLQDGGLSLVTPASNRDA